MNFFSQLDSGLFTSSQPDPQPTTETATTTTTTTTTTSIEVVKNTLENTGSVIDGYTGYNGIFVPEIMA
jgi:hypothetical protein